MARSGIGNLRFASTANFLWLKWVGVIPFIHLEVGFHAAIRMHIWDRVLGSLDASDHFGMR